MVMTARAIFVLCLAAVISGCYESTDVTGFEPGVYKGEADPLLSADAGERAQTLEERLNTGQTDR